MGKTHGTKHGQRARLVCHFPGAVVVVVVEGLPYHIDVVLLEHTDRGSLNPKLCLVDCFSLT